MNITDKIKKRINTDMNIVDKVLDRVWTLGTFESIELAVNRDMGMHVLWTLRIDVDRGMAVSDTVFEAVEHEAEDIFDFPTFFAG